MLIQLETKQIVFLVVILIVFFISTYFLFQFIKTFMVLKGFMTSRYIFTRAIKTFLSPITSFNRYYETSQAFRAEMVKEGVSDMELELFDSVYSSKKRLLFSSLRSSFFFLQLYLR
ncbi:hypothetical protein [Listeria cornellensis]|uniref:Uncharacterized protein n=1 Tax=Listeria cornellensis FSL F6-0969 TaxID=1265820 RepID=W7BN47_9LIST|nr:hypothetical protein [Listeria cornellensis]EUJ27302.1 hypothetical protein PCORN_13262 [Listeria cornellensis FSL F6-0969]